MVRRKYRAINFDLVIKDLEMYYSSVNPQKAYKDIKKYLETHGFIHRQWSGYRSVNPMSDIEVMSFMDTLLNEFPWLIKCAAKLDVTEVGKIYDIRDMHDQGLIGSVQKALVEDRTPNNTVSNNKLSLDDVVLKAKERVSKKAGARSSDRIFVQNGRNRDD